MSAYLKFFQLEKSPFDTKAQSALVLGTKALRTAYAEIEDALANGAPRICVDGKAGLGKTSLARALPKLLGETARVVLILNPSLPWSTLRSAIVKQLDLAEGNLSRKTLMRARAEGRRLVIAIDQAERISSESLDHLDILLGYKNDDDDQLLHCVLLANLETAASQHNAQGEQTPLLWWLDRLNTLQLEFQPIPAAGVTSYVQKHLKRAGWKGGQIFTPDALQTIHRLTGGVPREMSDLCERALQLAAEEENGRIDAGLIEDVFGEIPLEEVVGDPDDTTDSAFIGARDDDASSTTTTFGSRAPARPRGASGFDAEASDMARPAPEPDDDPRVDRIRPAPGRSIHAPVEAPISLDSFFGDSLDGGGGGGGSGGRAKAPPEAVTEPMHSADDEEAAALDDADPNGDLAIPPARGGKLKWIGIAAGALIVAGVVSSLSLSMLGRGAIGAADETDVIARPKASPNARPAPIAGIEAEELRISPSMAAAAAARDARPAAESGSLDEIDPLDEFDARSADSLDSDRAASDASAPSETTGERIASQADSPEARDTAEEETGRAQPAPPANASGTDRPAAPAPDWQNPADAEIEAPYW